MRAEIETFRQETDPQKLREQANRLGLLPLRQYANRLYGLERMQFNHRVDQAFGISSMPPPTVHCGPKGGLQAAQRFLDQLEAEGLTEVFLGPLRIPKD